MLLNYLSFLISGRVREEIIYRDKSVIFDRYFKEPAFDVVTFFFANIEKLNSIFSKCVLTSEREFMAIIKNTIVDWESIQKNNSPVLSAFFELNDKEVTMSKYYYNNFKRIQTLFIFSIENKPSLIIDCKYDYGKTFREVNLNLGYLESSTKPIGLLYHDSALIINSLEHTKIILIENPSLMNGFSDFFSDLFIFKINQIKK